MSTRRSAARHHGPDAAVFVISVAAELTGLHPQTLRTYERMGLITPARTNGGGRRYSARDLERLREIADLTAAGIGIEGVRRILDLQQRAATLAEHNESLLAEVESLRQALQRARADGETRPAPSSRLPALRPAAAGSLVVWRRGR